MPLLTREVSSIKNDFSFNKTPEQNSITPTATNTAATPTPASSFGFTDQDHPFINEWLAHHSNTRTFNDYLDNTTRFFRLLIFFLEIYIYTSV